MDRIKMRAQLDEEWMNVESVVLSIPEEERNKMIAFLSSDGDIKDITNENYRKLFNWFILVLIEEVVCRNAERDA